MWRSLLNNGSVFDFRPGSLNRPMPGVKWAGMARIRYSFAVEILPGDEGSALGQICARSLHRAEPPLARLSLSHFPRRRASWKPIGPNQLKESFAGAQFACEIRSWGTVVDGNKLMTKSMIGSRFAAASAVLAARRLRSCQHFLSRTAITA